MERTQWRRPRAAIVRAGVGWALVGCALVAGCEGEPGSIACAAEIDPGVTIGCVEFHDGTRECPPVGEGPPLTELDACPIESAIGRCEEPSQTYYSYPPDSASEARASCDGTFVELGGTDVDPCAGEDLEGSVGCNGFATGDPAPGEPAGSCTPDETARGSCERGSACRGVSSSTGTGFCVPVCGTATLVATSTCPTGFRCLRDESSGFGSCLRDCDEAHPCPGGIPCLRGSCVVF